MQPATQGEFEQLNEFFARSIHDLKGPLSRMYGLIYLIRDEIKIENADYIDKLEDSAQSMNELLDRITQCQRIMEMKPVWDLISTRELNEMIQAPVDSYSDGAVFRLYNDLPDNYVLRSDPGMLKIIINNLLHNAFIFRESDPSEHEVSVTMLDVAPARFIISVEDNGPGIKSALEDKLFKMFSKGQSDLAGLGLGLYEVKLLAEKLGGGVQYIHGEGEHTIFEVYLPT